MPKKPIAPHPLAAGLDHFNDQVQELARQTFHAGQGDMIAAMTLAAASFMELTKRATELGIPGAQAYAASTLDIARAEISGTDHPKPSKGH